MAAPRYEISLCVENISWVRAETKGNIFQHKKKDFVSPNKHVMFCLLFSQGIITCIIVERLSEDVRSRWQFLGQTLNIHMYPQNKNLTVISQPWHGALWEREREVGQKHSDVQWKGRGPEQGSSPGLRYVLQHKTWDDGELAWRSYMCHCWSKGGKGGDSLTPTWPTETNHPGILYLALSRVE